jgi:hypothetical protein
MIPSTVPVVEVDLFGEKTPLKYGFRALQEMGLNPYDPKSIAQFNEREKDCRGLAAQVRAGMLHLYFGLNAPRKGQEPPTVDDVMDELDPISYVDIWLKIKAATGTDEDTDEAQKEPDPPSA